MVFCGVFFTAAKVSCKGICLKPIAIMRNCDKNSHLFMNYLPL